MLVIIGATGTGKTKLAIELAKILDAEIVSCDARQIYKYMDIGTAKPMKEEIKHVHYWLIDIVEPNEEFNAWSYALIAREKIREIEGRNKLPIVVGGSGLYLKALVDGFFIMPKKDKELREKLNKAPVDKLYQRLIEIDKESAIKLHPNDRFRIIRAIEVYEITGKPLSLIKKERVPFDCKPFYVGLTMDRKLLYKKIDERVAKMIENGLINETKKLVEKYKMSINSLQTIGYREIISYLNGKITLDDAINLIKRNTRRYAKRQMTWFRKIKNVHWIEVNNNNTLEKCLKIINEGKVI